MKKIYRSGRDKKIAGICGGLGEIFAVDSTLVRLAFVFLCLSSGVLPLLVTYIVGWIIIPVGTKEADSSEDKPCCSS